MKREYRDGYITINSDGPLSVSMSLSRLNLEEVNVWAVERGYGADAFYFDRGTLNGKLVNQALLERRKDLRKEWPVEAKSICDGYERKIHDLFLRLDASMDLLVKRDHESQSLKSQLSEAKRVALRAEEAAEEMARRAKASDPARLRRDIEAEFEAKASKQADENRQLAARLHEVESQMAKLTEDKRRLRAALNTRKR